MGMLMPQLSRDWSQATLEKVNLFNKDDGDKNDKEDISEKLMPVKISYKTLKRCDNENSRVKY